MYSDGIADNIGSVQYTYSYVGGGSLKAGCMYGSTGHEYLANYAGSAACTAEICGYSQYYPAVPVPASKPSKYIFITQNSYDGNFISNGQAYNPSVTTGESGADAVCQYEADNDAGSLLPVGGKYKALLVSKFRYPCDSFGLCGGASTFDWPIGAYTGYLTPTVGRTDVGILSSDENNIFNTTYLAGLIKRPDGATYNNYYWSGINGLLTGVSQNTTSHIVGWSYANESEYWPGDWAGYTPYVDLTCQNWTSNSSIYAGWYADNGIISDLGYSTVGLLTNTGYSTGNASDLVHNIFATRWATNFTQGCNYGLPLVCVQQ